MKDHTCVDPDCRTLKYHFRKRPERTAALVAERAVADAWWWAVRKLYEGGPGIFAEVDLGDGVHCGPMVTIHDGDNLYHKRFLDTFGGLS